MTVLHAVETLSPDAGGLPVAVHGLTNAPGIGETIVLTESPRSCDPIRPAVIHQHGIWARVPVGWGQWAKRAGIPLVISPHGMLEPWALGHHAWRKRLAWLGYQRANLRSAAVLHAASELEAASFRALGLVSPIAVIPHGVEPIPASPLDPDAVAAPKSKRGVLFLSRLHPKKGIELILRAWAELALPDWELILAGPDEGGHRKDMESLAARLGLANRARFTGPLLGKEKDTAFRRADVFVLPSHSENFGFVIAEALQYGLPAIATTGTPWQHLPAGGCGWCVTPEAGAIRDALREATGLSDGEREAMGRRGAALVEREHGWPALVERWRTLYRWLAGGEPRPEADWFRD